MTGSLSALPVVIPNDQAGANFFTQGIAELGQFVQLRRDDQRAGGRHCGSGWQRLPRDAFRRGFTPFVSPLPDGEVANITINPDGNLIGFRQHIRWRLGDARPLRPRCRSPRRAWLLAPIAAALLLLRRRRAARTYN